MTRRNHHRDVFARLALLAALLLAIVPTLGRMVGHEPVATAMPTAHMHRVQGMDMAMGHAHAGTAHAPHAGASRHSLPHEHDADCAYCPLLATTLVAPMQAFVVAPATAPAPGPSRRAHVHVPRRLHGSLGSRGPPALA